jgi:N-acetylmuramoyl-L-alanine amidase
MMKIGNRKKMVFACGFCRKALQFFKISPIFIILWTIFPSFAVSQDSHLIAYAARLVGDDARARLLIEFSAKPDFTIRYLANPNRIVIDLKQTKFGFPREDLSPRGFLTDIRYGTMAQGRSRIVLSVDGSAVLEDRQVQLLEDGRYRLVLDMAITEQSEFDAVMAEQTWDISKPSSKGGRVTEAKPDKFIVVLDAGHGGIDGGAEGRNGAIEKLVTLDFVLALKDELKDNENIKLILTREDDRFLSLSSRVRLAQQVEADLFVSVHADSIRQRSLRGASVYTLSQKASDQFTASLAEAENRTDVLAGLHIDDASDEVTGILIDLAQRETKVFSDQVAERIVGDFEGQVRLLNNPHRRAGFRVLQAPDVPSVLIELGFLSNLTDEKLLSDAVWRKKATQLLAKSINEYSEKSLSN